MLDDIVNSPAATTGAYRVEDVAMTEGIDMFDYDETENSDEKVYVTHRYTFHLRDRTICKLNFNFIISNFNVVWHSTLKVS